MMSDYHPTIQITKKLWLNPPHIVIGKFMKRCSLSKVKMHVYHSDYQIFS